MIIGLQRRAHQIGRIRIGEKVAMKNGKARPSKLETFRLTSADRRAIEAASALYGGTPRPWDEQEGQWGVVTETAELPIAIPPNGELSQFYETWSGGGCVKRCDGVREMISDQPCVCDPEDRECKPHTRLSVVLTELPGVGMWRLDTQGWYAATELGGTIALLAAAADRGTFLPARLRLDQRQVKRPGQQVRKFAVPVVDLDVPIMQVPALLSGATRQLANPDTGEVEYAGSPTGQKPPGFGHLTPVPESLDAAPTVAEQVKAADDPPSKQRASTPKLPASGRKPRAVADADREPDRPFTPKAVAVPDYPEFDIDENDPGSHDGREPMPFPQKLAMQAREAGIDHHHIVEAVAGKTSSKDLTLSEQTEAAAALAGIVAGTHILEHDDQHKWTVRPRDEGDDPCPDGQRADLERTIAGLTDEQRNQLGSAVKNRVVRLRDADGEPNARYSQRHYLRTLDALEALGFDVPAADPVA